MNFTLKRFFFDCENVDSMRHLNAPQAPGRLIIFGTNNNGLVSISSGRETEN
jgi:hypothetical protein